MSSPRSGRGRNWSTPYIINLLFSGQRRREIGSHPPPTPPPPQFRRVNFTLSLPLSVFIGDAHKLPANARTKSAHTRNANPAQAVKIINYCVRRGGQGRFLHFGAPFGCLRAAGSLTDVNKINVQGCVLQRGDKWAQISQWALWRVLLHIFVEGWKKFLAAAQICMACWPLSLYCMHKQA